MSWGNTKQDIETFNYVIDCCIREVLNNANIAEIDRMTRTKLVNRVMLDRVVLKGEYNEDYIKNLIKRELSEIEELNYSRPRRFSKRF